MQLENGARLIGRWMTQEQDGYIEVLAIWEYDDRDAFERIEASVRADAEHMKRVDDWKEKMGGKHSLQNVFYNIEQDFLESTVSVQQE
ncbi:NIPSNAP family protein [Planococcus lenghuensis]|uniref:NIPSNAP family protein n=1 Tax=Planococcus lenghuensis TaxID=2213202 RepID=UPI001E2C3BC7|nr:NIPSNAP family protein [Planococcus lenghuensis]